MNTQQQETFLILRWGSLTSAYNIYLAMKAIGGYEDTQEWVDLHEYFHNINLDKLKSIRHDAT